MIIDGKKLAAEVAMRLAETAKGVAAKLGRAPVLAIVLVGDNSVSARYVARKQKLGAEIGVVVKVITKSSEVTQAELIEEIKDLNNDQNIDGVIVQLPLPSSLNQAEVLMALNPAKDIDALSAKPLVASPIVLSIAEILRSGNISVAGQPAVVVGNGRLVGQPVAEWLRQNGAIASVVDTKTSTSDKEKLLREADIIVSGVGQPNLITPDQVKEGAVLIDAGTSEQAGKLAGDFDQACATTAKLFTPVPGGVGPLTVVMLFQNLLYLANE